MSQQLTRSLIRRNDKKMALVVADGLGGAQLFVRHVKQYRFTVLFRGDGLHANVNHTDPRTTGVASNRIEAGGQEAEQTASAASEFVKKAAGCRRGAGAIPGEALDAADAGPRRAVGQVWSISHSPIMETT